jgi:hypothetical protein
MKATYAIFNDTIIKLGGNAISEECWNEITQSHQFINNMVLLNYNEFIEISRKVNATEVSLQQWNSIFKDLYDQTIAHMAAKRIQNIWRSNRQRTLFLSSLCRYRISII